jgi:hypothetical protein
MKKLGTDEAAEPETAKPEKKPAKEAAKAAAQFSDLGYTAKIAEPKKN